MAERSLFWGGVSSGDCGPYDEDDFALFLSALFCTDLTTQGVIRSYEEDWPLNVLASMYDDVSNSIVIFSGRALVYGTLFESDANEYFPVTFDPGSANYYRVVLRKSWAAKTVRLALLGPQKGSYPSLTQTAGTTWEISLYRVKCGTTEDQILEVIEDVTFCSFPSN